MEQQYIGRRVRVTLAAVEGAGAGAPPAVPAGALEADVFAFDAQNGLVVFRSARATTFMKADYTFVPAARCTKWEDLGEGEKVAVANLGEAVARQRFEASRKREEEMIECTSELVTDLEQRFFWELRKSCVARSRAPRPRALPVGFFFSPPLSPPLLPFAQAPAPQVARRQH